MANIRRSEIYRKQYRNEVMSHIVSTVLMSVILYGTIFLILSL